MNSHRGKKDNKKTTKGKKMKEGERANEEKRKMQPHERRKKRLGARGW